MRFIAKKVYTLKENVDYLPGKGTININDKPITALHCIIQPQTDIVFRTLSGQVCKFPPSAFVAGGIYPYEIRQVNAEAAKCFLGLSE